MTTTSEARVRREVSGGFVVTLAGQAARLGLALAGNVSLARILGPADYGINALVAVVTGLMLVFSDVGLSLATIQKRELTAAELSSAFWLQVVISFVVCGIAALVAPLLAWIYGEPRLTAVVWCLAPVFVVVGLYSQPQALLRRRMRFGLLALADIVAAAVALAVALTAALYGLGYWALALQSILQLTIPLPFFWLAARWRPSRPRIGKEVLPHVNYSMPFFAHRLLDYAARSADKSLLGWHFGPADLGLYERATSILAAPMSQITMPLTHVLLPALSRLQDDRDAFKRLYLSSLTLLAWLTMPLSGLLVGAAEDVVWLLLGPQWTGATEMFRYASITSALSPVAATRAWILLPLGHSDRVFKFGLGSSLSLLLCVGVAARFGPNVVAAVIGAWVAVILVVGLSYATIETAISRLDLARSIIPPLVVAGMVAGVGRVVLATVSGSDVTDSVLRLSVVAVGALVVSIVVLLISRQHAGLLSALRALRPRSTG